MIMPRGNDQLLLPVNPLWVGFTLLIAFALNVVPMGRVPAMPDFLALVLVFWNIHQPRKVGIGIAFLFGLLMDIHQSALLGEHALFYSLLSYGAIGLHRRVPWFGVLGRMLHVLALLLAAQCAALLVRAAVGSGFPGWDYLLASFTSALLWPLTESLLLAPQRRAIERDENRPL